MSMYVGESLIGEGLEVAHIDLLIGDKSGPVGAAFASALADQNMGHSNLLAVMEPNVAVKPSTVMITKVTIKGAKQAVQMFGPAQKAVADAVCDCVSPESFQRIRPTISALSVAYSSIGRQKMTRRSTNTTMRPPRNPSNVP